MDLCDLSGKEPHKGHKWMHRFHILRLARVSQTLQPSDSWVLWNYEVDLVWIHPVSDKLAVRCWYRNIALVAHTSILCRSLYVFQGSPAFSVSAFDRPQKTKGSAFGPKLSLPSGLSHGRWILRGRSSLVDEASSLRLFVNHQVATIVA
jgi:hypothetical protein